MQKDTKAPRQGHLNPLSTANLPRHLHHTLSLSFTTADPRPLADSLQNTQPNKHSREKGNVHLLSRPSWTKASSSHVWFLISAHNRMSAWDNHFPSKHKLNFSKMFFSVIYLHLLAHFLFYAIWNLHKAFETCNSSRKVVKHLSHKTALGHPQAKAATVQRYSSESLELKSCTDFPISHIIMSLTFKE